MQSLARRPAGAKLATDAAHWIIPVPLVIKGPSLPRLARPLDGESLLHFITGARTFFRVLGVAVGISTSLSSGRAEIEEYDSHNKSLFIYTGSAFTGDGIITFASNNNTTTVIQPDRQYKLYNMLYDDDNLNASTATQRASSGRPTHGDDIRDDLIPSTVWGLEVSNGVRFDPNYNYLMTTIGRDNTDVLADNTDVGGVDNLFQEMVGRFRGASCDVELFERRGLKHCDVNDRTAYILDINTRIASGSDNGDGSTTPNAEGGYYFGASNPISVPIETTQGTPTSIQDLSAQENSPNTVHDLSALVDVGALQGSLRDRSPAGNRCYDDDVVDVDFDVSASCRTSPITGPVKSQIPHGFSERVRVFLPIVTRTPVASAVPEISTWIMFIIGFVIITLLRWNKLNYEGRYRVFVKIANKIFLDH